MANNTLSIALGKVLNSHFTDFITQISEKHNLDVDSLLNDWSEFSGLQKKKPAAPKFEGPYGDFTVKQLKEKCKAVGLKVGGKKTDLIERLAGFDKGEVVPKALDQVKEGPYAGLTVKELKEKLKEKGLKVGGKKTELIDRLNESDNESESESDSDCDEENYSKMTVKQLKEECDSRGLSKSGKKADLIGRLQIDDDESDCSECDTDCETDDEEVEDVN